MFSNSILQQLCIVCTCTVLSHSVVSDSLRPHGLQPTRLLCPWGFARQEYWSRLPCPLPGDPPNPGIEPRSPALQADALPGKSLLSISATNPHIKKQNVRTLEAPLCYILIITPTTLGKDKHCSKTEVGKLFLQKIR